MLIKRSPFHNLRFQLRIHAIMGNQFECERFKDDGGGYAVREEIVEFTSDFEDSGWCVYCDDVFCYLFD